MTPTISIYLDTRRKKDNNTFPVKLRVYFNKETRLYPTGIDLTENDFERSFKAQKPGREYRDLKEKLESIKAKAIEAKDELKVFAFDKFEKRFLRPTGAGVNVFYHYEQAIERFKKQDRINSIINHQDSSKSLKKFLVAQGKNPDILSLDSVTVEFLEEYEQWMTKLGRTKTTIGFYLRPLRAIFNKAIADGEILQEMYPFGKRKYQIPAGSNPKKCLSREALKKLMTCELEKGSRKEKARAFWMFSYLNNGMNMRDIAELKYKNIGEKTITFIRSKTKNSTKANSKTIVTSIIPYTREIINQYGNPNISADEYVFPIINKGMTELQKVMAVKAFICFIDAHIKKLAKKLGIDENISTYWARHSFTTITIQNGATLSFVQDALGHMNIRTTMNYWGGFEDATREEFTNKLMNL